MLIKGFEVRGIQVDEETRCVHYHTEIDRIAIKFHCCGIYYPCYECHQEIGCGQPDVWPKERFGDRAILCGACGHELTIAEYLECKSECPQCSAPFNPGCKLHRHLYFAT
nr:CHY zinc finger protein [Bacillus sp. OxB-1]